MLYYGRDLPRINAKEAAWRTGSAARQAFYFSKREGSMKQFVLISLFGFTFLSAAKAQNRPDWVSRPYSVYPESLYVAAVGAGNDRQAAAESARKELAAFFKQSISSRMEIIEREQNRNGIIVYGTDVFSKIEAAVENDSFIGADVKEYWNDAAGKTGVWAVAVMDKAKGRERYGGELAKNINEINRLIGSGAEITFKTLALCKTVQERLATAESNAFMVMMLDGPDLRPELNRLAVKTDAMLRDAKAIPFDVKITGDEDGTMKPLYAKEFNDLGIRTGASAPEIVLEVVFSRAAAPRGAYYNTRYSVSAVLKNARTGEELFAFPAISARASHKSQEEADRQAVIDAKKDISKSFPPSLREYLGF
jgi:hypothetical protein